MSASPAEVQETRDEDVAELAAIPMGMIDAWHRGDATGFAASFADDAEFVAFEGTRLTGRQAIVDFHQPLFDTVLKGSRLVGAAVDFVRVFEGGWAVVHSRVSTILPGRDVPSSGRASMEIYTVRKGPDGWRIVALQNARVISLDRQVFLDDVDAVPADVSERVAQLVAAVAQST